MEQVALVTGASSGFGRLIVETLARNGQHVFATMRDINGRNAGPRNELVAFATGEHVEVDVVEMDVAVSSSVDAAADYVAGRAGRIDVVVNNAGVSVLGVAEAFTPEQTIDVLQTNFLGSVRVNRAVLPHMRQQGSGLLIQISSGLGRVVLPFMSMYAASKHAVEAYAQALRYELSPFGIDSIIVEPGSFPTPIFGRIDGPADAARAQAYGRIGDLTAAIRAGLTARFDQDEPPDPQEVADALLALIQQPIGTRPLRTLVGKDTRGIQPLNDVSDRVHGATLEWFGVGELLATSGSAPEGQG